MTGLSRWARRLVPAAVVVLVAAAVSGLFGLLGMPSPALFGSLAGALGYALVAPRVPRPPVAMSTAGQAVIGVSVGAMVDPVTLQALAGDGLVVVGVCLATLALSLGIGQGLCRHGVSPVTAAFAFIAGGASGITAMSHELGADDRVVSVVQYLRVVLIVLGMPLATAVVFRPGSGGPGGGAPSAPTDAGGVGAWFGTAADLAFVIVGIGAGLLLARLTRAPAGGILGPMLVAGTISFTGVFGRVGVPVVILTVGYALVGIQVGLRFTREALSRIAGLIPTACVLIVLLVVASAGLGVFLSAATGRTALDGYLATTPGGLFAVLATAVDTGADVTFVLAVQVVRVLIMLLVAPVAAQAFRGRRPRRSGAAG